MTAGSGPLVKLEGRHHGETGGIRGRPDEQDRAQVEKDVVRLLGSIHSGWRSWGKYRAKEETGKWKMTGENR